MKITKGLKIAHLCNFAEGKSGMYESVKDICYYENEIGYNAKIVDVVANNPLRLNIMKDCQIIKDGLIVGIEEDEWTQQCEIINWHRYLPEEFFSQARRNFILWLHGQPDFVFLQENDGKDKAYSLIKGSYNSLPQCRAFVGMWEDHDKGYWEHLLRGKLLSTGNPWIRLENYQMNSDVNFDPNHIKLVCMDTWRSTKTPFYVINAVITLIDMYEEGKLPYKVTLDIFGQDIKAIKRVWFVLTEKYLNKYIFFRGYANVSEIFNNYDIVLTTGSEETRVIRESLASGMPLIVGETHCKYSDYKAPFRAPYKYAEEIMRLIDNIKDKDKRKALMEKNRNYALENFDVRKNSKPIFELFERIYRDSLKREYTPTYFANLPKKADSKCNFDINKVEDKFSIKILSCCVFKDNSIFKELKNVDKYHIPYQDIVNHSEEEEYILDYILKDELPEKFFDYIYIDYYDILTEDAKKTFWDYLLKIAKNGEDSIIKGELINLNNV